MIIWALGTEAVGNGKPMGFQGFGAVVGGDAIATAAEGVATANCYQSPSSSLPRENTVFAGNSSLETPGKQDRLPPIVQVLDREGC